MKVDLHLHTKFTDGSLSIGNLITLAKANDVSVIAITDHDCLAAIDRAKIDAGRVGIEVIPAVELSATVKDYGKEIHILSYFMEAPDRLQGICHKNTLSRKRAATYVSLKFRDKLGIHNDLILGCADEATCVFKPHFMLSLMQAGLTTEIYGELYEKLFNPDSPDFVVVRQPKFAPVKNVIQEIHDAGGIAILAHPALYEDDSLLEKYVDYGIDGIEVWHPTADEDYVNYLTDFANKHKLLMTGGSDFHGMFNRAPCEIGSYGPTEDAYNALVAQAAKIKKQSKKSE